jgi:hypothetical protein
LRRQRFKQASETSNATLGGVGAKKSVFFCVTLREDTFRG